MRAAADRVGLKRWQEKGEGVGELKQLVSDIGGGWGKRHSAHKTLGRGKPRYQVRVGGQTASEGRGNSKGGCGGTWGKDGGRGDARWGRARASTKLIPEPNHTCTEADDHHSQMLQPCHNMWAAPCVEMCSVLFVIYKFGCISILSVVECNTDSHSVG